LKSKREYITILKMDVEKVIAKGFPCHGVISRCNSSPAVLMVGQVLQHFPQICKIQSLTGKVSIQPDNPPLAPDA
jgi:hypothetical protein